MKFIPSKSTDPLKEAAQINPLLSWAIWFIEFWGNTWFEVHEEVKCFSEDDICLISESIFGCAKPPSWNSKRNIPIYK